LNSKLGKLQLEGWWVWLHNGESQQTCTCSWETSYTFTNAAIEGDKEIRQISLSSRNELSDLARHYSS